VIRYQPSRAAQDSSEPGSEPVAAVLDIEFETVLEKHRRASCGPPLFWANRSADRLNKKMPPVRPSASRAIQSPFLLRPTKNGGIDSLTKCAGVRPGRKLGDGSGRGRRLKSHVRMPVFNDKANAAQRRLIGSRRVIDLIMILTASG
jgi:hypothetical protein